MNRRGRWTGGFLCLLSLIACLSCDGGRQPAETGRVVSAPLRAGRTAADAEARAAVFAAEAARYRRLAEESRQAAAALALDVERQAQIAAETQAPVRAPLPPTGPVDPAAIAPASVRVKREAAAALADRLAAAAQQAADFQTRRAAEIAGTSGGRELP